MSYIQNFKQKFPDKVTPEMVQVYHGGNSKIDEFTFDSEALRENKDDLSGILFLTDENEARKKGPYVTKAMLKLNRIVSSLGPPSRSDIVYMLSNVPNKDEILKKFDEDPREAYFKATDHILKGGAAHKCYTILAQEFYKDHAKEFAENMVHIRYDAVTTSQGDEILSYIVLNPKCINIIKK